ncbi:MAG: hypothetical protein HRU15_14630 [Planctomycetes bacterium]|nr:hypothetical protein [Planctomycetota bacterium]
MAADRERERKRKNYEKNIKREEKKAKRSPEETKADIEQLAIQLMTADKKGQKKIMKQMEALQEGIS